MNVNETNGNQSSAGPIHNRMNDPVLLSKIAVFNTDITEEAQLIYW
jgi:hypothetical protein